MEINAEKTKLKTKNISSINTKIKENGQNLETVTNFKYLGSVITDEGSYHHHQSLNRESRWGTTDDFETSFLHFSPFSTALWYLPNSRPVHSLMLSSHLFLSSPSCLLSPFTVPCKMVLVRANARET